MPRVLLLMLAAVLLAAAAYRPAGGPLFGHGFTLSLSIGALVHVEVGLGA